MILIQHTFKFRITKGAKICRGQLRRWTISTAAGLASIDITTEGQARKSAIVPKDYRYTYHDPTENYASLGIEVNLNYNTGKDMATFDISPIVLAEKRVGVKGRIIGAETVAFTKPGERDVTLEEDGTFPEQEWVEAYDNTTAYPYALTADGGERYPHAIPATFSGPLFQDSTSMVLSWPVAAQSISSCLPK